ncbi:uncharacterized protein DSM5745_08528 [Aspergillus mulundensis]|uniref:F-box domain-containing protein n=1 Tax=Aspergillus mulundensis TaxID=1810919 RepID=A0A3D8R479_9EURO|nr:hypothetical protein DSM5745_08528 [Aspergillus mulundensis]RDW68768.1 hypothetical protein DSM5745_08528 [Aspergillus mulundensis]
MASLITLPPECLIAILKSCDTPSEALTFASSCKHLQEVFDENRLSILGNIAQRQTPAFEDALMTIRATRIVLEHFNHGELPPNPFPLDTLTLKARRPTAEDLRDLRQWQHLVKCIEDIVLNKFEWGRECDATIRHDPATWSIWQENFHRAIYRFFLMGAVLCGAYQDPLSPAGKHGSPPSSFNYYGDRMEDASHFGPLLRPWEMAHFLKYPVFNFEAHHKHEPIYGPLAELMKNQTELRARDLAQDPADVLLKEMVDCLAFSVALLNPTFEDALWRLQPLDYEAGQDFSHITVIPLGHFYPEIIQMPNNSRDAHNTLLLHGPVEHEDSIAGAPAWHESAPYMRSILYTMHSYSEQPNHWAEGPGSELYPTPPPPIQIFQYMLRKYLGCRFAGEAFDDDLDREDVSYIHLKTNPFVSEVFLHRWPDAGDLDVKGLFANDTADYEDHIVHNHEVVVLAWEY